MNSVIDIADLFDVKPEEAKSITRLAAQPLNIFRHRTMAPTVKTPIHEQVTDLAMTKLRDRLHHYGSTPNRRHEEALRAILTNYSEYAYGLDTGRKAYALATALGKTESIVAWCSAVFELQQDRTVLVCQDMIRSLDNLYRKLLDTGIPAERIGIFHCDRDGRNNYKLSTGDPRSYQFILITHEMIKSSVDVEQYTTITENYDYHELFGTGVETRRSLVVYDESLIKSESRVQIGTAIDQAAGALSGLKQSAFTKLWSKDLDAALAYLRTEVPKVSKEYKSMLDNGMTGSDTALELAPMDSETISKWKKAIKECSEITRDTRYTLSAFLENSQEPIRLADLRTGKGSAGVLSFILKIPDNLQNLVCLDASAAIRLLMHYDNQIDIVEAYIDVKSFDCMELEQLKCAGGNGTIKKLRKNSPLVKEVVEDVIGGWLPNGAACIICTKKNDEGKKQPIDTIKAALKAADVDTEEQIEVLERDADGVMRSKQVDRFVFLTWGQERSTNAYRHCSHIIAVGVLRRDILELAAQTAGQHNDLMHDAVTSRQVAHDTQVSEQFFRLQQLVGRGTSRKTINGVAAPSWVRVYDQTDFSGFTDKGLPNVQWTIRDKGVHVKPIHTERLNTKKAALKDKIKGWMVVNTPAEILVADLRSDPQFSSANPKAFQRALNAVLKDDCGYRRSGLSLVQVGHVAQ